jgi:hypothetical protein
MFRRFTFRTNTSLIVASSLLLNKNLRVQNSKRIELVRHQSSPASADKTTANNNNNSKTTTTNAATLKPSTSINNVTLVGVVHDIQLGYVYETRVCQFVITTTSIDTTNPAQDCVVEKDHHTIRCFGESFAEEMHSRLKEGAVVCTSGRLRLNPQLEQSCGKHFYFPYVHVEPPFGSVSVVHGDHRRPPSTNNSNSNSNNNNSQIPVAAASAPSTSSTIEETNSNDSASTTRDTVDQEQQQPEGKSEEKKEEGVQQQQQ